MKTFAAAFALCLVFLPCGARAADSQCLNSCLNSGYLSQSCAAMCAYGTSGTAGTIGTGDYLSDRMRIEQIRNQRLEVEKTRIQLQRQKFECVAACKNAGNTGAYCDAAC